MVCNRMLISPNTGNCQESHKTARSQGGHTDPWLCMYQERKGNVEGIRKRGLCTHCLFLREQSLDCKVSTDANILQESIFVLLGIIKSLEV